MKIRRATCAAVIIGVVVLGAVIYLLYRMLGNKSGGASDPSYALVTSPLNNGIVFLNDPTYVQVSAMLTHRDFSGGEAIRGRRGIRAGCGYATQCPQEHGDMHLRGSQVLRLRRPENSFGCRPRPAHIASQPASWATRRRMHHGRSAPMMPTWSSRIQARHLRAPVHISRSPVTAWRRWRRNSVCRRSWWRLPTPALDVAKALPPDTPVIIPGDPSSAAFGPAPSSSTGPVDGSHCRHEDRRPGRQNLLLLLTWRRLLDTHPGRARHLCLSPGWHTRPPPGTERPDHPRKCRFTGNGVLGLERRDPDPAWLWQDHDCSGLILPPCIWTAINSLWTSHWARSQAISRQWTRSWSSRRPSTSPKPTRRTSASNTVHRKASNPCSGLYSARPQFRATFHHGAGVFRFPDLPARWVHIGRGPILRSAPRHDHGGSQLRSG